MEAILNPKAYDHFPDCMGKWSISYVREYFSSSDSIADQVSQLSRSTLSSLSRFIRVYGSSTISENLFECMLLEGITGCSR
jgi:hypothetical protein